MALPALSSRGLALLVLGLLIIACSTGAEAHYRPGVPRDVSITRVQAVGSGCPGATGDISISADRKAITIPFRNFQVSVPARSYADKEKSCVISIQLQYPAGWSYVATGWTFQGWVELDRGLVAYQSAKYYYQGGRPACYRYRAFYGGNRGLSPRPFAYQSTCNPGLAWSPCGAVRGLNVLTRIWIDNRRNRRGQGVIKSEVIDGQVVAFVLHLGWRHCH